ncbi:EAL domain-containing protein [Escherichia coli]|uniref:EAL domain-containing protein n=1 Tax=Escherichia coli TaxID=562 RepID=UPI001D1398AB|nr:EAL domain-containing protein [Escherichia coli]EIG1887997.1 EAL domain-containing protein [Escherichia coli]HEI2791189.1 EAL domain-containing protein [Escherichia coli]HEI3622134.1 EAL domain-containing protein [Escherichia coli]HEI3672467.1 EAL domain-containing protein [Escherichia coli]HEI4217557.1 EAL domain-containing protein [Escherichia coli]
MQSHAVTAVSLVQALNNGEFEPYIQPVVRSSDLSVSGGELLVHWHKPTGEIILPTCFIERIDSAGLLLGLTQKILCQTVNSLADIKNALPPKFRLAVNITPAMLADAGFTQMCLELAGVNNIRLVLELTEQHPFGMNRQMGLVLDKLSAGGVEFALDDFGTGCSVLAYLKYFPVSYIKIDKSFIQGLPNEDASFHIIECVVNLAQKLQVSTVTEGVEIFEQAKCLNCLGVDYLQGFYFGKPKMLKNFISAVMQ